MGKIWMPGGGDSDISNTKITTAENITTEFPVPEPGDAVKTFLGKMKKFTEDFKDLKTGLLTMGMLVNNCVTDDKNLPLSAAQGKKLMDLFTQLNGEVDTIFDTVPIYASDFNILKTPGRFYISQTGDGALNAPSNINGFLVVQGIEKNGAMHRQDFYNYNDYRSYSRYYLNGTWGAWKQYQFL